MTSGDNYTVLIWKKGEVFHGRIRELGIIERANDLPSLWELLDIRKQDIIQRFNDAGLQEEIPEPLSTPKQSSDKPSHDVLRNSMVIGTVVVFCLLLLGVALWSTGKSVSEDLRKRLRVNHIIYKQVKKISKGLNSLSDTEREVIHQSLRTIAHEGRPFVKDIKPLFEELVSHECAAGQQETLIPLKLLEKNEKSK